MTIPVLHSFTGTRGASKRLLARIPIGARCQCNICGQKVQSFLPYHGGWADVPPLMRELGVIGSDVENYECPACGCHDRERHLLMYFNAMGLMQRMGGSQVLHFAPELHLQQFIRDAVPEEYVMGDLYPSAPGVQKIDVQAIPYPSEYFDFIIANHVLEHVDDDRQALYEIARVLRPGGQAILQTPFSTHLARTLEDRGIASPLARLQAYGQEDHRRLYGQDMLERFHAAGLQGQPLPHDAMLPDVDVRRHGVNPNEPLMLFRKPKP